VCGAVEAVEVVAEVDAFAARRGERRGVKEEFIVGKERTRKETKDKGDNLFSRGIQELQFFSKYLYPQIPVSVFIYSNAVVSAYLCT
jgi:hypothetical protein